MKGATTLFAITFSILMAGCMKTEFDFDAIRSKRDYSLEVAKDVEIVYSDSAIIRVKVQGPELKRYIYRFKVEDEFPEGVDVEFFDENELPQAWMHANYALRKQNEKTILARDSVILRNVRGESLRTSELLWNEGKSTLSTEQFVMITRPPGDTIYSRGFKSNQDFSEYTLYSVEGDMTFSKFKSRLEREE